MSMGDSTGACAEEAPGPPAESECLVLQSTTVLTDIHGKNRHVYEQKKNYPQLFQARAKKQERHIFSPSCFSLLYYLVQQA